jgi:hypothetical protein
MSTIDEMSKIVTHTSSMPIYQISGEGIVCVMTEDEELA